MLGTIALIAWAVCGYLKVHLLILVPAAMINAFLGLHFPPGKAEALQARGMYWQTFLWSVPLQAALAALIYGIGRGIRYAVDGFR